MSESFRIRPARRGDREGISALLKELGYADPIDLNILSWVISHPEMEVFMAVDPLDRAIGMLSLSHRPQLRLRGRVATIDELIVTAAWRGKGIGRKLVQAAVARVKDLTVKRLEVATHLGREEFKRSFYEKNGFVEVDNSVLRLSEFEKR